MLVLVSVQECTKAIVDSNVPYHYTDFC